MVRHHSGRPAGRSALALLKPGVAAGHFVVLEILALVGGLKMKSLERELAGPRRHA